MQRWQLGQDIGSIAMWSVLAICGGMFMLQPLQVPLITGTTATPPRCLRMRSY